MTLVKYNSDFFPFYYYSYYKISRYINRIIILYKLREEVGDLFHKTMKIKNSEKVILEKVISILGVMRKKYRQHNVIKKIRFFINFFFNFKKIFFQLFKILMCLSHKDDNIKYYPRQACIM